MNATAKIQNTNLAELRIVWSTRQNSFEQLGKTGMGSLKSYGARWAKIKCGAHF
jgi:hypothetical protein